MKKYFMLILAIVMVSALVVGCTDKAVVEEKDDMVTHAEESMTEEPMDEMKDETSEEPMAEESEKPMAEESEEPMEKEEMMIGTKTEAGYIDVSPEEAQKLIESVENLVIIDVSPLYANGHIPGAINHYVGDGSLDQAISTLDSNVPYLVYCHSDSASISGAKKLVNAGFETVYRLEGNFGAWVEAGFPVE